MVKKENQQILVISLHANIVYCHVKSYTLVSEKL